MGGLVNFLANAGDREHNDVRAVVVPDIILEYETRAPTLLFAARALELHRIHVPNPQFAAILLVLHVAVLLRFNYVDGWSIAYKNLDVNPII